MRCKINDPANIILDKTLNCILTRILKYEQYENILIKCVDINYASVSNYVKYLCSVQ
jgi:hypothetical protein